MVRQHIDKYTNVRHNMQVMTASHEVNNQHLLIKLLLSGQVERNPGRGHPGGLVVPMVKMSIGAVKPLNVIHVNIRNE
jgi:hypothetical protein